MRGWGRWIWGSLSESESESESEMGRIQKDTS